LASAHNAFLDALDAVIQEIERTRQAGADLETFFDDDDNVLTEFGRSCAALQQLAEDRSIDVALSCATE
jgi:hypothetical protein